MSGAWVDVQSMGYLGSPTELIIRLFQNHTHTELYISQKNSQRQQNDEREDMEGWKSYRALTVTSPGSDLAAAWLAISHHDASEHKHGCAVLPRYSLRGVCFLTSRRDTCVQRFLPISGEIMMLVSCIQAADWQGAAKAEGLGLQGDGELSEQEAEPHGPGWWIGPDYAARTGWQAKEAHRLLTTLVWQDNSHASDMGLKMYCYRWYPRGLKKALAKSNSKWLHSGTLPGMVQRWFAIKKIA